MQLFVVSIRDRAADVFGQPNFVTSLGGCIRSFSDEVNRKAENNVLNAHPEDFDLYEIGSWFDDSCRFVLLDKPRQIAIGKDVVRNDHA